MGRTLPDFMEVRLAVVWTTTGILISIRDNVPFDFGDATYPGNPDPASMPGRGNLYTCANATDEQKAAAFQFIKLVTSEALFADQGVQIGYVARRQIAALVPEISTYEGQRVNEVLNAVLQAALTGQQTNEAAVTAARAEAKQILSAYRV